ncbi:MAG TPA: SUMF1/EgtB/PvdO family nonheme iron enzyme, partial [Anaerolineae bacterium]|nr:SUMF1/EgtB/PvdO family nonheme iron enzyme [Anaerolineae bacterium]
PVNKYRGGASPYGVMDMAGNVLDWTSSWYDADRDTKVLRGGSWIFSQRNVRCAYRIRCYPDYRYYYVGFRCARSSP